MAQIFKSPLDQADEILALNRENRRNTLNKRINDKGNYELAITGGSNALDNQSAIKDSNAHANTMTIADPNGVGADWTLPGIKENIEGLNNRYGNRNDDNFLHTARTKRGRRLTDIWFNKLRNGQTLTPEEVEQFESELNKYEGNK